MRIIKLSFCLIFPIVFGLIMSDKIEKRRLFYCDYKHFIDRLIIEITYQKKTVVSLIKTYDATPFFEVVSGIIEDKKANFPTYILSDEKEYIISFSNNVGLGDSNSQRLFLEEEKIRVGKIYSTCEEKCKVYKPLYIKLGIVVGLILFVLVF